MYPNYIFEKNLQTIQFSIPVSVDSHFFIFTPTAQNRWLTSRAGGLLQVSSHWGDVPVCSCLLIAVQWSVVSLMSSHLWCDPQSSTHEEIQPLYMHNCVQGPLVAIRWCARRMLQICAVNFDPLSGIIWCHGVVSQTHSGSYNGSIVLIHSTRSWLNDLFVR